MKILIVDDAPIFREPIEAVLRSEGFETFSAPDGRQALAMLGKVRPDLVILDLGMPVMDGLSVLRTIRAQRAMKALPVLILSAEAERGKVVHAVQLGVSGYMLKSAFSLKELLARVKGTVGDPARAATRQKSALHRSGSSQETAPGPVPDASGLSVPTAVVRQGKNQDRTADAAPHPQSPAGPPATAQPGGAHTSTSSIADLKPQMTRAELMERLKVSEELKGLSPTVTQVLKLTASDQSSVERISRAISQDQAMALKILKLANSSVYSRGDRVDTVHKAVLRIGMENIRQAVMNIGVVERFNAPVFSGLLSTQQFWEHSIACGIFAAEIAHALRDTDAEAAFTTGLLHDLGRVLLGEALGETYIEVVQTARRLQAPLEQVESRLLPMNHADVIGHFLGVWKFPRHLTDPVIHHHVSAGNARSAAPTRSGEVIRLGLANRLAHAMLLGSSGNDIVACTVEHCRMLNLPGDALRGMLESVRQQTDDMKFAMLSCAQSGVEPRRVDQVRGELGVPFVPRFVATEPEIDAFRVFCDELAGTPAESTHTVVVAHLTGGRDSEPVAEQVRQVDAESGGTPAPLVILAPTAQITLPQPLLSDRPWCHVQTPFTVTRFVESIRALVQPGAVRAAA
jgi:HD-like signal output (HDOD) protein/CheY-like chemotaxis protein